MAMNPLKAHELARMVWENQDPFQWNPQGVEEESATQALNQTMTDTH